MLPAPKPSKPAPELRPPSEPGTWAYWRDAVLDELDKPGGGLFGRRAATVGVALVVFFLLVEQQHVSYWSVSEMAGGLLAGIIYVCWPLVTGSWWARR